MDGSEVGMFGSGKDEGVRFSSGGVGLLVILVGSRRESRVRRGKERREFGGWMRHDATRIGVFVGQDTHSFITIRERFTQEQVQIHASD